MTQRTLADITPEELEYVIGLCQIKTYSLMESSREVMQGWLTLFMPDEPDDPTYEGEYEGDCIASSWGEDFRQLCKHYVQPENWKPLHPTILAFYVPDLVDGKAGILIPNLHNKDEYSSHYLSDGVYVEESHECYVPYKLGAGVLLYGDDPVALPDMKLTQYLAAQGLVDINQVIAAYESRTDQVERAFYDVVENLPVPADLDDNDHHLLWESYIGQLPLPDGRKFIIDGLYNQLNNRYDDQLRARNDSRDWVWLHGDVGVVLAPGATQYLIESGQLGIAAGDDELLTSNDQLDGAPVTIRKVRSSDGYRHQDFTVVSAEDCSVFTEVYLREQWDGFWREVYCEEDGLPDTPETYAEFVESFKSLVVHREHLIGTPREPASDEVPKLLVPRCEDSYQYGTPVRILKGCTDALEASCRVVLNTEGPVDLDGNVGRVVWYQHDEVPTQQRCTVRLTQTGPTGALAEVILPGTWLEPLSEQQYLTALQQINRENRPND